MTCNLKSTTGIMIVLNCYRGAAWRGDHIHAGPQRNFTRGFRAPLASGTLVETCIVSLYSNQNRQTANVLRFTNRIDCYTANWLARVILGLVAEILAYVLSFSWVPVPSGPRYKVPLAHPSRRPCIRARDKQAFCAELKQERQLVENILSG